MTDDYHIPSTPDPAMVAQIAAIARTLIAGLAGAGLLGSSIAAVTDAQISAIVTGALMLVSIVVWVGTGVWSWRQKRKSAQQVHDAAVASAVASSQATMQAGQPVAIPVQPATAPPP